MTPPACWAASASRGVLWPRTCCTRTVAGRRRESGRIGRHLVRAEGPTGKERNWIQTVPGKGLMSFSASTVRSSPSSPRPGAQARSTSCREAALAGLGRGRGIGRVVPGGGALPRPRRVAFRSAALARHEIKVSRFEEAPQKIRVWGAHPPPAPLARRALYGQESKRNAQGRRSTTRMRAALRASGEMKAPGPNDSTERYRQPKAAAGSCTGSRYISSTRSTRFTIQ